MRFFIDCVGERDKVTMANCTGYDRLAHTLVLNGTNGA